MSLIDPSTVLKGDLHAREALEIQGEIEGRVESRSDLTVGTSGKVSGAIHAPRVVIQGEFEGTRIEVSRQLEILEGAKIKADQVQQPDLIILSSKVKTEDISSGKMK